MSKWNASVVLTVYITYDDIEADSKEEAEQIAKDRALKVANCSNCDAYEEPTVYSSF